LGECGIGRNRMRVTSSGGANKRAAMLDGGLNIRSDRGVRCLSRGLKRADPGSGGISVKPDSNPRPALRAPEQSVSLKAHEIRPDSLRMLATPIREKRI
jgi:hypothetical protein